MACTRCAHGLEPPATPAGAPLLPLPRAPRPATARRCRRRPLRAPANAEADAPRDLCSAQPAELAECVRGLSKRLGGARSDELVGWLEATPPKLADVADALLAHYYDAMYEHQMRKKGQPQQLVECDGGDALANARRVLAAAEALPLVARAPADV